MPQLSRPQSVPDRHHHRIRYWRSLVQKLIYPRSLNHRQALFYVLDTISRSILRAVNHAKLNTVIGQIASPTIIERAKHSATLNRIANQSFAVLAVVCALNGVPVLSSLKIRAIVDYPVVLRVLQFARPRLLALLRLVTLVPLPVGCILPRSPAQFAGSPVARPAVLPRLKRC